MSSLQPAPPPGGPVSPELERVLLFISAENERHQSYFKQLFDRAWWFLAGLVVIVGAIGVWFGFNTVKEAKGVAEIEAKASVKEHLDELVPKMQEEVRARVSKEFESPNIEALVRQEARKATELNSNHIIRREVATQVTSAVQSQRDEIHRSLVVASRQAVDEVKGEIQIQAQNEVTSAINQTVVPELKKLNRYTGAAGLFPRARDGDSAAFDSVASMAADPHELDELRKTAQSTLDAIERDSRFQNQGSNCRAESSTAISELIAQLKSNDRDQKLNAIGCLSASMCEYRHPRSASDSSPSYLPTPEAMVEIRGAYPSLDALFQIMTTDPELETRAQAFYTFQSLVSAGYRPGDLGPLKVLDNLVNSKWWHDHRSEYVRR